MNSAFVYIDIPDSVSMATRAALKAGKTQSSRARARRENAEMSLMHAITVIVMS